MAAPSPVAPGFLSRRGAAAACLTMALGACAQTGERPRGGSESFADTVASFDPKQIGKADIDRVADLHRREVFASLRVLAEKLYRRNPREWKKGGHAGIEAALDRLFDPRSGWRSDEAAGKRGTEAILLALREDFAGDRVAVLVAGIGGMLHAAFEEKTEFFLHDELVPQKIHNSARNLEIAAWKLANARDAGGTLLLLSNEIGQPGLPANLSFEREFGKMIGNLDLLAALLADKGHRTIARVAQSLATAVFLPVPSLR